MLKSALEHAEELNRKLVLTWYDPHYQYAWNGRMHEIEGVPDNDRQSRYYVSYSSWFGAVGYISYWVNHEADSVADFIAVNFYPDHTGAKVLFARDLLQAVDDVFLLYNFNRLEFVANVDNPAIRMYDKFIRRLGGRVVGTTYESTTDMRGKRCDERIYEILQKDYLASKEKTA